MKINEVNARYKMYEPEECAKCKKSDTRGFVWFYS